MRRMTLIGLGGERDLTVDALAKLGCVHLDRTQYQNTTNYVDEQSRDELQRKMSEVNDCLSFIKLCEEIRAVSDKKEKARNPYRGFRIDMGLDDFERFHDEEMTLYGNVISNVKANSAKYYETENDRQKLLSAVSELSPYDALGAPLSEIKDTAHTAMFLGTVPLTENKLADFAEGFDGILEVVSTDGKSYTAVFAACGIESKAAAAEKLSKLGFVACPFDFDATPRQKAAEFKAEADRLKQISDGIAEDTCRYFEYAKDLKLLYDYYGISLQKIAADGNISKTQKTFMLEGWVPFDKEAEVRQKLDEILSVRMLEFRDPTDEENPPTLTRNNKIVAPYECITNMYSVPNYRERDPNAFVAVFYFMFFGIMLGDAGYGLILTLGALLLAKIINPAKGTRSLIYVIAMGGVSTVMWGALFGGWFALDTADTVFRPLLFNPLDNPIGMVALSLGIGAVQICTGLALNGIAKIKKGKAADGILDDFLWVLFFAFIAAMAVGMALEIQTAQNIGLYGMLGSLVVVFLTAGRHKKGVIGKITGGFGGLYKIIGFVSDLLSYLRLFGLGLATGVIGMVFNEIAKIMTGPIGTVFAAVVLLAGHTLNIAINVLGAYVHDSRLQFIEFFSRFYTGEGYLFQPIVGETKYTNINN